MRKLKQWLFWRDIFKRRAKRLEITVETKETFQLRRISKTARKFCPLCRVETIFLSLSESASLLQTDILKIEILLAGGRIHFTEQSEDQILICIDSLKTEIEKMRAES